MTFFVSLLLLLSLGCQLWSPDKESTYFVDFDQDGHPEHEDCDDAAAHVNPSATEICNGIDDDCDGAIDSQDLTLDPDSTRSFFRDADGDGHGDPLDSVLECRVPNGFVDNHTDCNDANPFVYTEAEEFCNGVDDDCDSLVDEDAVDPIEWFVDLDSDGHGAGDIVDLGCEGQAGLVSNQTDCDDSDPEVHPDSVESCNGIDDNCNGFVDDQDPSLPFENKNTFYPDKDGDGFGDSTAPVFACFAPAEHVANDLDCNDLNPVIRPDALEICDGLDNDCNPSTIELGLATAYDGDGMADLSALLAAYVPGQVLVLDQPTLIQVCGGPFYLNVESGFDVDIIGVGAAVHLLGSDAPLAVIENASITIDNVVVSQSSPAILANGAQIQMSNAILQDNSGTDGGALQLSNSLLTLQNVEFTNNVASNRGGALYGDAIELLADNVVFSNNEATEGGGLYLQDASVLFSSGELFGNQADFGGIISADNSDIQCDGGASFHQNVSQDGAVMLSNTSTFTADACDFESDSTLDNYPIDIGFFSGMGYRVGNQASFSCQNAYCGNSHASLIGDQPLDNFSNNNAFRGNVYDVSGTPTLDGFGMEMDYNACTADFYVFERPSVQGAWTLLWHEQVFSYNLTGWLDSPIIGKPLSDGTQVMLGVGWVCDSAPDYWTYSSAVSLSSSIGLWSELRGFDHQFNGSAGATYSPMSTLSSSYLYRQRILLTRLSP